MNDETKEVLHQVQEIVRSAHLIAARGVNTLQVMTNFEIGRLIVENEQSGSKRADYGQRLLANLSRELEKEFGKGFSRSNLEYMRRFYLEYSDRAPEISQTPSGELPASVEKSQAMSGELTIRMRMGGKSPFTLNWSHYVFLMGIKNEDERRFYEIESAIGNWSLRELKRQFESGLYERLALSRDKRKIKDLSVSGDIVERPEDMLRSPYVLEFLGLDERASYSERELETAIIDRLEQFLLELGKGFLFEARQKRLTFESDHFFVDLVFYNRILQCYVLVDLKIGRLTHQDLGQMQMYVNYYDRHVKSPDEKPTIGIILCKTKSDALVELTLPKDINIYPAEYRLYLPSKAELRRRLIAWIEEEAR